MAFVVISPSSMTIPVFVQTSTEACVSGSDTRPDHRRRTEVVETLGKLPVSMHARFVLLRSQRACLCVARLRRKELSLLT
eukprot:3918346-Amphidinium_carterae.1